MKLFSGLSQAGVVTFKHWKQIRFNLGCLARCGCWPCWAKYAWPSQPPWAGQHTFLHRTSVTFWYLTHLSRKRPNSYLLFKLQIDHRYSRYRADAYCICSISRSVWWGIYFISILHLHMSCKIFKIIWPIKQFTWWVGLSLGLLLIKK